MIKLSKFLAKLKYIMSNYYIMWNTQIQLHIIKFNLGKTNILHITVSMNKKKTVVQYDENNSCIII